SSPQQSEPRNVRVAAVSPAAFTFEFGGGPAAIVNVKMSADDGVIDASIAQPEGSLPGASPQPARRGGVISIYTTGLGDVSPAARDGENSLDVLRHTARTPRVLIGGTETEILFSGLAPQFVGVYQINARISPDAPTGDAIPLQIVFDESTSRGDVTLAIRP
ncbi:MAG TPA: hypothetical protein VG672_04290, partial [Bryobacteraceae bacterium]|nr:hypothetical protein [Bryobacteraceae bacterium]